VGSRMLTTQQKKGRLVLERGGCTTVQSSRLERVHPGNLGGTMKAAAGLRLGPGVTTGC
jgi:hypothetical protein